MTDSATLHSLAERCEQAAWRGSRDIDKVIATTLFGGHARKETRLGLNGRTPGRLIWTKADGKKCAVPRYTSSLDAAMSLVPEGCAFDLRRFKDGRARAVVWRTVTVPEPPFEPHCERAATPALALAAASLRARATLNQD